MSLTHSDIADIIRLVNESDLDEMVIEVAGLRIEARRKGAVHAAPAAPAPVTATPNPVTQTPASPVATPNPSGPSAPVQPTRSEPAPVADGMTTVTAPMVGTFYRCPTPEEPPFVEPGSEVESGAPLCLVEVMKLFTTIYAPCAGTVREVRAEDAELVEYGQVLFVIEPR